ncbi:MAG: SPOR domain-containing protein [Bacteroidales bacterium]
MTLRQEKTDISMHTGFKILIFVSLFLFPGIYNCFGQKTGKVEVIVQDARISTLVAKHVAFNESRGSIKGFRIQIFFDSGNNSKNKAITAMNEFKAKHPKTEAYLMFLEPNYKVRVGDFRSRMDAQHFLYKIAEEYPNAFIVKDDEINFPNMEEEEED